MTDFSLESAWWLNQMVADQVYSKSDRAAPLVKEAQRALDSRLLAALDRAEAEASAAFAAGDAARGAALLSEHAVAAGATASAAWRELWQALLVKFVDGRVTVADPTNGVCGCSKQSANFSDAWKAKVIADTADHYLKPEVPNGPVQGSGTHHTKPSRPKLTIRGVAN